MSLAMYNLPNNTPQAYQPDHRHDAQTPGVLFCWEHTTTSRRISSFRPLGFLKNFIRFLITPENGNSYNIIYNHVVTIT